MITEIAISDVLLTVRLQNALGKFYSNEDYSLENHEFFNPIIVESDTDLTGKIESIKVLKGNQNTLFGEIVSNFNRSNYAA